LAGPEAAKLVEEPLSFEEEEEEPLLPWPEPQPSASPETQPEATPSPRDLGAEPWSSPGELVPPSPVELERVVPPSPVKEVAEIRPLSPPQGVGAFPVVPPFLEAPTLIRHSQTMTISSPRLPSSADITAVLPAPACLEPLRIGRRLPEPAGTLAERRRLPRYECNMRLNYEMVHNGCVVRGEGTLDALNLIVGGLKVHTEHRLEIGGQLRVQLPLTDGLLETEAKVVWVDHSENTAGIEFQALSDSECCRLLASLEGAA